MADRIGFDIADWYWVVGNHNPTTQVFSSATSTYVANNAAAYITWLSTAVHDTALGYVQVITAMADNGSGKVRLTVASTTPLATNQRWYFRGLSGSPLANGLQQITVVDATHIDITAIAFVADTLDANAALVGATIIDTEANLYTVLDHYSDLSFPRLIQDLSLTGNITLTNPVARNVRVTPNADGWVITFPAANEPDSIPLGIRLTYINPTSSNFFFTLQLNGSTSVTLPPGWSADIFLTDNTTAAGVYRYITYRDRADRPGMNVQGLIAKNNAGTPNTKVDITWAEATLVDFGYAPFTVLTAGATLTVDIGAAGPVVNGRDQAAAFGANAWVHFFAMMTASQLVACIASVTASRDLFPTAPTGYVRFAYLFSVKLTAGAILPTFNIGPASLRTAAWRHTANNAYTDQMTDGQLLVGQASSITPQPKTMSGDATIANTGAITIANDAVTYAKIQNVTNDRVLMRDTAGSGDVEEGTVGNGLEFTGGPGIGIANDGVTNARLANMSAGTFKMRKTASTGDPEDATTLEAIGVLSAAKPAFRANKNGTDQTGIASGTDTKLTFGTEVFDTGSYYDTTNSKWTPPAGTILIQATCLVIAGVVDQNQASLIVYKNGAFYMSGPFDLASGTGVNEGLHVSLIDTCNGTDYYEVYVNVGGAGNKTVYGQAAFTYFQGTLL